MGFSSGVGIRSPVPPPSVGLASGLLTPVFRGQIPGYRGGVEDLAGASGETDPLVLARAISEQRARGITCHLAKPVLAGGSRTG
eukprot:5547283-Alexandrium_andersonii.AAC.1